MMRLKADGNHIGMICWQILDQRVQIQINKTAKLEQHRFSNTEGTTLTYQTNLM